MLSTSVQNPPDSLSDTENDAKRIFGLAAQPVDLGTSLDDDETTGSALTVMQYLLIMASTVSSIANISSMTWLSDNDDDDDDEDHARRRSSNRKASSKQSALESSCPPVDPILKIGLSLEEWQALCNIIAPIIDGTSKSTGAQKRKRGRPPKLSADRRLLNCLLFLKKDESMSRALAAEDCIYICELIGQRMGDEIAWPDPCRRAQLSTQSSEGCIGVVDDLVVQIPRPLIAPDEFYSPMHHAYALINAIAVDHDGFIVGIDPARPGALDHFAPAFTFGFENTDSLFTATNGRPIEYLVGPYKGLGTGGVVRRFDERAPDPTVVLKAFQARRAGHRIRADWGVAGLQSQWAILSEPFTARRDKFKTILKACCILTNFLHRRRRHLHYQVADDDAADRASC